MQINTDDYIELTSYSHHPFYRQFAIEVPDNWARNLSCNVKLDELVQVIEYALKNGYTLVWDGDTSEESFQHKKGVATMPELEWDMRSKEEQDILGDAPEKEKQITQEIRQNYFDNHASTDDHLMHLVGIVKDQNGTVYFKTKNSWGTKDHDWAGYLNMSTEYVKAKTVSILVHRDGVPKDILEKLE